MYVIGKFEITCHTERERDDPGYDERVQRDDIKPSVLHLFGEEQFESAS